ncbi:MAG: thiamine pyrophosphate-dependent enzyme, partial [Planctomycetes bacterium]|nr:thiamine pyrophosphate-dependent enzyme [Planctomycetota bacterium]
MTMATAKKESQAAQGAQETGVANGNEMAAHAASQINFHLMGYYPITPSTQVAEALDEMKADGEHDIAMVPGDGEHGAAGICTGGSLAGGRSYNVTAAQGLLYALEQLPAQAGLRLPMLLNVSCRAINSPLNILCDHSDIMFTLNTGWVVLTARDPQMIYDMNIVGVKLGELPEVRLPVIVAYDGFFTSHQKRRVRTFTDPKTVQAWIGPYHAEFHALDPAHPVTQGPYMNAPDLTNQKVQCAAAMEAAAKAFPGVLEDYKALSGRSYSVLEGYRMDDAEAALFLLNSAYDTAKAAVDDLRAKGHKVGLLTLQMIRPFPVAEVQKALKKVKVLCVGDRQDGYSSMGGNMSVEIRAALKDDPENRTQVFSRIYGLGGREFYAADGEKMLEEALRYLKTGKVEVRAAYFGADAGDESFRFPVPESPIDRSLLKPGLTLETNEHGRLDVKGANLRALTKMPKRFSPGHGACPGCGIFPALDTFFKGIEGDVVVLFHTGCAMVVTTGYPFTAHNVNYIHNLFQSGAATLSGVVEMYYERKRRGELPADRELTFVMVTGDGGHDIGMGPSLGAALRGHRMIIVEYDNQGYMNTGAQLSYSTPFGHRTSTSHVGPKQVGKRFQHKDMPQIMAASNIPYVFTGCEVQPLDLIRKAAKAQHYARNVGTVYGKLLSCCPLSWNHESNEGPEILKKAVDCNFFPLYEIEKFKTTLTYNPEERNAKVPVTEWLKLMGKTRHLLKPENADEVKALQDEVDRRFKR